MLECIVQPKSRSIIVYCVKINLSISVTLRVPLLQHTVMVPALRLAFLICILLREGKVHSKKKSVRIQETDSPLESRCDYFRATSGKP